MSEGMLVELVDHQEEIIVPTHWIEALRNAAEQVWPRLPEHACAGHGLEEIEMLDISLVSAAESDRIHREFMGIAGETDVITFLHGELIICPAVAAVQAAEHGEPILRELLRYIIHGMLHLAGHLDDEESRRSAMERVQEVLVAELWSDRKFIEISGKNAKNSAK